MLKIILIIAFNLLIFRANANSNALDINQGWTELEQVTESEHPYASNTEQSWTIEVPNAQKIKIYFEKIETEQAFDKIFIELNGKIVAYLSGDFNDYLTEEFIGNRVTIRLKSDQSESLWGFKISKILYQ